MLGLFYKNVFEYNFRKIVYPNKMRTLILLACVVVGCFAFQDMAALKRRLATPGTSEAIAQTVRVSQACNHLCFYLF